MLTETIELPKEKARQAYLAYAALVKRRQSKENEVLKKAYYAASQGKKLLDIQVVFDKIGTDQKNQPRLAIARAGFEWVYYQCQSNTDEPHFWVGERWDNYRTGYFRHVRLRAGTFQKCETARAMIPIVPAHLQPDAKITNYHILFEPRWEDVPADPMLLKHLGGSLYVVLACWDETPLENAVLRMGL